jgi:hypothetical protein
MSAPPLRPMSGPPTGGFQRFDDTDYNTGGFAANRPPSGFGGGPGGPGGPAFGGRRARMDMTHEMRFDLAGSMPTSGGPASPGELQRIDSMRRTFTARRFGSGYDAIQVNGCSTRPSRRCPSDPGASESSWTRPSSAWSPAILRGGGQPGSPQNRDTVRR